MRHIVLASSAILIAVIACGVPSLGIVQGSGRLITQTFEVGKFDQVELVTMGDLHVEQGAAPSLTIETDDNIMPLLTVDVKGSTLVLGDRASGDIVPTSGITYRLTVRDLSSLAVSGSGRIFMETVGAHNLAVRINGSGDVDLGSVDTGVLSVISSGSGHVTVRDLSAIRVETQLNSSGGVTLAGKVDSQSVTVNGSGSVEAADLLSQEAVVVVSASGGATVHAVETLGVTLSGSGGVGYYGSPTLTQSVAGSGTLTALGPR